MKGPGAFWEARASRLHICFWQAIGNAGGVMKPELNSAAADATGTMQHHFPGIEMPGSILLPLRGKNAITTHAGSTHGGTHAPQAGRQPSPSRMNDHRAAGGCQ